MTRRPPEERTGHSERVSLCCDSLADGLPRAIGRWPCLLVPVAACSGPGGQRRRGRSAVPAEAPRHGRCSAAPSAATWSTRPRRTSRRLERQRRARRRTSSGRADLGSMAYGGPVIAGGRIFVGTNNESPRDPSHHRRQGRHDVLPRVATASSSGRPCTTSSRPDEQRLAQTRHRLRPRRGRQSALLRQQPLRAGLRRCRRRRGDRQGQDRLEARHDQGAGRLSRASLANCSPLVVGDLVFVVTGNGVDRESANVSRTGCSQLRRREQEDRQGGLEGQLPGQEHHGRAVVQSGCAPRSTA